MSYLRWGLVALSDLLLPSQVSSLQPQRGTFPKPPVQTSRIPLLAPIEVLLPPCRRNPPSTP